MHSSRHEDQPKQLRIRRKGTTKPRQTNNTSIKTKKFGARNENQEHEQLVPKKSHWHGPDRPSARLDPRKSSDPFGRPKRRKSNFVFEYTSGSVPCRLDHGTVSCRLHWDIPPESLAYDPLLITCVEGLVETEHPFAFVARTAITEMLEAPGGADKASEIVNRLIPPLRVALMSKDADIFNAALKAVQDISYALGVNFNPYLGSLLIQVSKRMFSSQYKHAVMHTLYVLSENGGPEATTIIKRKVPTFSPV